jgi:FkbM family methyltransferase
MPLAGGAEIILSNLENYSTLAYTEQLWDFSDMLFLLHFLRPESLFVDIGANVGCYTVLASAVAKASSIAVEPVPKTHDKLRRNIRLNDIESRVETLNIGLADRAGSLRFTETLGGLNHVALHSGIEIEVRSLDDVLGGRTPAMIKLDVEGFEMPVLRGAKRCLASRELKAIVVELNGSGGRYGYSDSDVHETLLAYDFAPHDYDPVTRRLTARQTMNTDGMNTLYCRAEDGMITRRVAEAAKVSVRGRHI